MTTAACPQCRKELVRLEQNGLSALGCHVCGGLWLAPDLAARVTASSIALGDAAAALAETPFPEHRAAPPCPICAAPMPPFVLPGTDVELDACTLHGTWFDRGELQTLVRELSARTNRESTPIARPRDEALDRYADRMRAEQIAASKAAEVAAIEGVTSVGIDVLFSIVIAIFLGDDR